VSEWRRCDQCRKVKSIEEYDDGATTCRRCLSAPAPRVRAARASGVTTTRAPRAAPEPTHSAPRRPLVGIAGSGDLEVRERRARRSALDALAENHEQEFELLMGAARRAEGLRG